VVVEVDAATRLTASAYDSVATADEAAIAWERRVAALREPPDPDREDPAALVRRFHGVQAAFYGGGPIEPLIGFLAEDIRWHVPGRNAIAGDYAGRDEVLAYFEHRRRLARATFRLSVRDVVAAGERVFQLVGGTVERSGERRSWETVGVLRVTRGRIHECWLLPFDQYVFDEVWSEVPE
jgi:ketosteroid isomerase-like protein